jgi:hypothetical protein
MQDTQKITKHFTNDISNIPLLKLSNKSAVTKQENVSLFADTLQEIFKTTYPDFSEVAEDTVRNLLNQFFTPSVRKTNHLETGWLIRHLKARRADGANSIQNIILNLIR